MARFVRAGEGALSHEQLRRLLEIQNEIVAMRLDPVEAMEFVADRAAHMTQADAGVVEIPDGDGLVCRAATGVAAPYVGTRMGITGSLSDLCLREGTTLRCDDADRDGRVDARKCYSVRARSMVCVPLCHRAAVVGVLKVYAAKRAAFDDGDAALLEVLASVVAAHISGTPEIELLSIESRRNQRQEVAGLRALARAIDAKDPMTRQHSDRVAKVATAIAGRLGWSDERIGLLREVALLHDVGKLGIPDSILSKPGRLTAGEYVRIKGHAPLGATVCEGVLSLEQVGWIRWHHERPDAKGYPDALADPEIPQGAAIIGLAESWDVMTNGRSYRRPMNPIAALHECRDLAGRQFRAALVDHLTEIV